MMISKKVVLLTGLLACLVAGSGYAQSTNVPAPAGTNLMARPQNEESEKIADLGDYALPLHVMEWIKGKPVKIQQNSNGTNIYVLVFCSLTRADEFAITNLNALEEKYRAKGLVTVAISPEGPDALRALVQLKGEDIDFSVAADELPGRTSQNYRHAFRLIQLPLAFIVGKDGKVLWHGHPLTDGMGEVVDEIVSGRYNMAATRANVISHEFMNQYLIFVRNGDPRSHRAGRMVLVNRENDAPGLINLAFQIATDPAIDTGNRDMKLATAALNRAEQLTDTNATDVAITRAMLLFQTGDQESGLHQAQRALQTVHTDSAKEEVEACIRAMELRMAYSKTNQVSSVGTNQAGAPVGQH